MSHRHPLTFLIVSVISWMIFSTPLLSEAPKAAPPLPLSSEELIERAGDKYCNFCRRCPDRDVVIFFERLKKAIREDDKKTIAYEMVKYPFVWIRWIQGKARLHPFYTPEDFIQHYDEFMTPIHKKGLLELAYDREHFPDMFITPCETLGDLVEFTMSSNNKGSLQSITSCDRVSRDSRKFCCADKPTSPGCQQPDYVIPISKDFNQ